ncbi:MAG: 4-hydroxybenzoate octaprenyltransferase [Gammaproteobacteria bacterium]|nr:4-hydroxybenzoate octaprenyltransferase [Gammaproteobacteria bacterium]
MNLQAGHLGHYIQLTRLNRPIGIFLLLWPALWALWVASGGKPDPLVLIVFVAGVVLMRSAGCAINDYADRHIDGQISRTQERPLAAGHLQPRQALMTFVVLCLLAFSLVLLLNTKTILLSIAAVFLAASYPFMKRFTHLPQAYLGIAFGWAVPMAFAAQTETIPHVSWLFFVAIVFWALAYDTMYAIADREDDLKVGVKSSAVLFGRFDRLFVALFQLLLFLSLILAGLSFDLGGYYYAGLAVASGFSIYQQYLIHKRDPKLCFQAFLNNNYVGLAIFFGIVLDYGLK